MYTQTHQRLNIAKDSQLNQENDIKKGDYGKLFIGFRSLLIFKIHKINTLNNVNGGKSVVVSEW